MDDLKDQVVEQGGRVEARFYSFEARVDARFESMRRTMIQLFAAAFAAFVGLISGRTALLLALL